MRWFFVSHIIIKEKCVCEDWKFMSGKWVLLYQFFMHCAGLKLSSSSEFGVKSEIPFKKKHVLVFSLCWFAVTKSASFPMGSPGNFL